MDPWQILESDCNGHSEVRYKEDKLEFEDNFEPPKSDKLPDSEEYIALLGMFKKLQFL